MGLLLKLLTSRFSLETILILFRLTHCPNREHNPVMYINTLMNDKLPHIGSDSNSANPVMPRSDILIYPPRNSQLIFDL